MLAIKQLRTDKDQMILNADKGVVRIFKPLAGKSSCHVNTKEFANEIRNTKLEEEECITS